jgi:beta-galactosidase/beta-glucuronidase
MRLFSAGTILYSLFSLSVYAQMAPEVPQLKTEWTDSVSPGRVLPAYPRPQMVRPDWQNLNGLWDYTLTEKDQSPPAAYNARILVPFPIESALSGVQLPLLPNQRLWYRRRFTIPALKGGRRLLLHFGAIDQQADVYINGKKAGAHSGGYDSFELDITAAVHPGENELIVSVCDPTDTGDAPHGKQTLNPRRILYTAVSGIWQTVWLETVPPSSIASLLLTPDVDSGYLSVQVTGRGTMKGCTVELVARTGPLVIATLKGAPGEIIRLPVLRPHLWSPDDPFLYDLSVHLLKEGKMVDSVGSYFGMRKVAIKKDEKGIERIYLNNRYTFNLGVLDQGYWPDGLYTAPTDAALKHDIAAIKEMGFNTIRKHIKIEPARWYYYCDKLGILVWQDMPSWWQRREIPELEKQNFEAESARHIQNLHNYPCIIMWCLFNEEWGSYDQQRLAAWVKSLDPSRILNAHTGSFVGNWVGSELTDRHNYPDPTLPPYQAGKAMVCGEFGGTFAPVPGHEWKPGKGFGHSSPPGFSLEERYRQMTDHLKILEQEGLSGSIFTEPFDVEMGENGLITYDRKVYKIPKDTIRQINLGLLQSKH